MIDVVEDTRLMSIALELARKAEHVGEVPVGAVVVMNGQVIGEGQNQSVSSHDPSAHAEIVALRNAAVNQGNYRLTGASLYVTLEPCIMCAGALLHARISRLIFGARDTERGAAGGALNLVESAFLNHRATVTAGVLEHASSQLLREFFARRR